MSEIDKEKFNYFMLKNKSWLLAIIFILAIFLRVFLINKIPSGLQVDEGLVVYNSYTLAETGSDFFGYHLPVHLEGFGWGENALLPYLLVLPIKIFGLDQLWILRLVVVLLNVLMIFFAYLLAKELFNDKIAILTAFFLAISPWNLVLSRILFNVNILPLFLIAGLYFLIKGIKNNKPFDFIGAAIFYSLSFYTYALSFLWLPVIFIVVGIALKDQIKNLKKRNYLLFCIVLFILGLPIFIFYLKNQFGLLSNLENLFIFSLPKLSHTRFDDLSILNNLAYLVPVVFLNNYLQYFNPYFLFIYGNSLLFPRFTGLSFLGEAPLIIMGLILTLKNIKQPSYKFLLYWFLLAPLPAAMTFNNALPHPLRFINALPVLEIFTALGAYYFLTELIPKIKKRSLYLLSALAILNLLFFSVNYFWFYPKTSFYVFQGLNREIASFISENYKQYDNFIILDNTDTPNLSPYDYLSLAKISPQALPADKSGFLDRKFVMDKVHFISVENVANYLPVPNQKNLYIYQISDQPLLKDNLKIKKVIKEFKDLNQQTIFLAAE